MKLYLLLTNREGNGIQDSTAKILTEEDALRMISNVERDQEIETKAFAEKHNCKIPPINIEEDNGFYYFHTTHMTNSILIPLDIPVENIKAIVDWNYTDEKAHYHDLVQRSSEKAQEAHVFCDLDKVKRWLDSIHNRVDNTGKDPQYMKKVKEATRKRLKEEN